jgi:hypothetical protein
MSGVISGSKKVFQLDTLSLVLACVVSMLFTKGVVEFLSNTSNKQDYHSTHFYSPKNDLHIDRSTLLAYHNLQHTEENSNTKEHNVILILQRFRTIRVCTSAGLAVKKQNFQPVNWYLDQSYKNALPSRWGSTVSIAHCKLVI